MLLRPHYLALPAQAVECRLANIMPVGSSWSKKACELLFAMTKEKPIAAIVTSVTKVMFVVFLFPFGSIGKCYICLSL